ncbi:hypothetical protein ACQBAT_05255 [Ornithinimicrobium sp. Y1847]|uniref:hypothetical protein n=1 Tax=Ornithinimicrobium sp. Y1847 TaxID=3405419 RepID=UPI003B66EED1
MTEDELPGSQALRRAVDEQEPLLVGPALSDVLRVRIRRTVRSTRDLIDVSDSARARELAARTIAWLAESVGAYLRLPTPFAHGHSPQGGHAPVLVLVDQLDLLGLTLDHAYDAAHRGDEEELDRQLQVIVDRFATRTSPVELVEDDAISAEDLDQEVVQDQGLEVGDDGIPRVPVPEQPDPNHEVLDASRPDPASKETP